MSEFDFSKLGEQISEAVESVIKSPEVSELKENIKNTVDSTLQNVGKSVNGAVFDVGKQWKKTVDSLNLQLPKKKKLPLKKNLPGNTAGNLLQAFGTLGSTCCIAGAFVLGVAGVIPELAQLIFDKYATMVNSLLGAVLLLPLAGIFMLVAAAGSRRNGRLKRFREYAALLKDKAYCDIRRLSDAVGKKEKFVIRELTDMTEERWFLEGHLDQRNTCFMATDEAYSQYLEAEEARIQREEEERLAQEREERLKTDPESRLLADTIEEGKRYVRQIEEANQDIPGEGISQKLDRLAVVCGRIFDYIGKKPEKLPDIRKLMSYYLPTVLKMVNAYREFDSQPVQGENIRKGKLEIENNLDEVNLAFERLFDQLFQEDFMDIASDISVLNTMLSGDGLLNKQFEEKRG